MAEFLLNIRQQKQYRPRTTTRNCDYKKLFRFEEENVRWIANHFLGDNPEKRGGALSSECKMKIFLRYLADPGFQVGVAEDLDVHHSTVSKTIKGIIPFMIRKAYLWIKFSSNLNQIENAKRMWQNKYRFPCAIGALDCTHITIEKPNEHGDEYVNRKGQCSINVQATCNAEEWFTSIDATWPGSVHDSRIWRNSDVHRFLLNYPGEALLLGDEGYGVAPWLMTPYRHPPPRAQSKYNKLLTKERTIIERCFGQVKRRFSILKYMCRMKLERIPAAIVCCCILHNIAKFLNDEDFEEVNENNDDDENLADEREADDNIRRAGQLRREEIAHRY